MKKRLKKKNDVPAWWKRHKAKNLVRRIEKYEAYTNKVKSWIKHDKKELQKILREFTSTEFLLFAISQGCAEPELLLREKTQKNKTKRWKP